MLLNLSCFPDPAKGRPSTVSEAISRETKRRPPTLTPRGIEPAIPLPAPRASDPEVMCSLRNRHTNTQKAKKKRLPVIVSVDE